MYILINDIKIPTIKITETYFYIDNSYELLCENNETHQIDDFIAILKPLEGTEELSIKAFDDEDNLNATYNGYFVDRIENNIVIGEYNTTIVFKKH